MDAARFPLVSYAALTIAYAALRNAGAGVDVYSRGVLVCMCSVDVFANGFEVATESGCQFVCGDVVGIHVRWSGSRAKS